MTLSRRDLLLAGAVGLGGLGGCLGDSGGGAGGSDTPSPGSTAADATDAATDGPTTATFDAHPATADVAAQPRLGSADADVQIVAFEDPSCPRCRAFERNTVPEIRSELVEPGTGSFVVRTAPLVYPWGEPAIHALEATYARDADAFWGLLGHYFEAQSSFDADNVRSKTASWLSANTELDGEGVVEAADGDEAAAAVAADVDAAEAANVTGTPTVFLFRDGSYVTRATGSVSFDLIRSALGL
jgi:protein-disulfide isomerase